MPDTLQTVAAGLLPDATRRLVRSVDALDSAEYAEPSGLPGWTRGHVVAHLALNAEGLARALRGVVDGSPASMYDSQEARDGDIAELAADQPAALRARLLGGGTDLFDALDAIPGDRWATTIERTPGGRVFAAADVVSMRLREVEIHHADLACGYTHRSWPTDFVTLLLDTGRAEGLGPLAAYAVDLDRTWRFGDGGPTVSGPAADLAWWLTGRGTGAGLTSDSGTLPQIGAM
ncbi:maleylpyruvate isomerase family mycothiol-dependent enzyme [Nocardioides sp. CN2-186]|uniref:maleylpyruvate isomerase family mycothiol-dependent enzyme n=1 Tax=Nocardioides tweenelious TaxID=3156607 RepID=UPI0032B4349C